MAQGVVQVQMAVRDKERECPLAGGVPVPVNVASGVLASAADRQHTVLPVVRHCVQSLGYRHSELSMSLPPVDGADKHRLHGPTTSAVASAWAKGLAVPNPASRGTRRGRCGPTRRVIGLSGRRGLHARALSERWSTHHGRLQTAVNQAGPAAVPSARVFLYEYLTLHPCVRLCVVLVCTRAWTGVGSKSRVPQGGDGEPSPVLCA